MLYSVYIYIKDSKELIEVVQRHHDDEQVEELRSHTQPGWAVVTALLGLVWVS